MPNSSPLPSSTSTIAGQNTPTKIFYNWLSSVSNFINNQVSITRASFDLGTGSGTVTPNPSDGLKQTIANNGAFTIAATSQIGDVQLMVTNGSSAGSITLSGFEKTFSGDSFDTTNNHRFVLFIYGYSGRQACLIRAMQ